MKIRTPVDFDLADIERIAPTSQSVRRDPVRLGATPRTHSAQRHRLDGHRRERLSSLASLVTRQPKMRASLMFVQFFTQQFRHYP
jgi:hypothetical protein